MSLIYYMSLISYGCVKKRMLDWSLLAALVDRWHPETHTYHVGRWLAYKTSHTSEVVGAIDVLAIWSELT
jgi:hypothetical protein